MAARSTWRVYVGDRHRTVHMVSPTLGRKVISVDGVELKKVGLPFSMWSNYRFDIDGNPAVIKFRAVKRMRGMSLFFNGEKVPPEPGSGMSAEAVQWFLVPALLLIFVFIFGLIALPFLAMLLR